ncbi:two-component system, NtrC family, C4-dicarboxylate transport sensor histidine kinase DctB [Phaeovulum vinaykumarii]|uniref:C4-dicarboxylate transport sensor protein DctB n=1 Tax=Phaeovulum vinaykumarii TaxID=407234 RepID=A0A1N7ME14_9RHOB|nr:two-component system, NtrC family, C4-dicarboxylate transport sensor histidine kinase DctB [Phaeovulum vinaykumarii]
MPGRAPAPKGPETDPSGAVGVPERPESPSGLVPPGEGADRGRTGAPPSPAVADGSSSHLSPDRDGRGSPGADRPEDRAARSKDQTGPVPHSRGEGGAAPAPGRAPQGAAPAPALPPSPEDQTPPPSRLQPERGKPFGRRTAPLAGSGPAAPPAPEGAPRGREVSALSGGQGRPESPGHPGTSFENSTHAAGQGDPAGAYPSVSERGPGQGGVGRASAERGDRTPGAETEGAGASGTGASGAGGAAAREGRPREGSPFGFGTGDSSESSRRSWALRLVVGAILALAVAVIWSTNSWLSERFTETTRVRAELRLALYSGNILSELQRSSVVPLLLARDPQLISSLASSEFSTTSARLISAEKEIEAASIRLLDISGRVVAATDRQLIGTNYAQQPWFVEAMRSRETVFTAAPRVTGGTEFVYSRALRQEGRPVGVIVVEADLMKFERSWAGISDVIAVADSEGRIILATEPRWRGLTLDEAMATRDPPSAIQRAFQLTSDWANAPPDAYLRGVAVMRAQTRLPFRGWRMISFTSYDSIRERVNAVLALEIMGFAILLAWVFYLMSRRARVLSARYRRESVELRALNARLSREIAERERVQKDLAVAEQTLAQSSKLAVLGEMSASVSHELNQPLAAMKTYLAGARLLLQRGRVVEALSSFQRIDDLIERMGAITRQLKSYARKGGEAFEPVDLRAAISSALSMMEPQLRARTVRITRTLPRGTYLVMADRIRLEQVIINLLRNAIDATRDAPEPQIELMLTVGETAVLSVRDNGPGIADLDKLFEPFWTTKKPGEGTGLGLAISSGIVKDFGGRLTAHNAAGGGAVFEMQLPLYSEDPRDGSRAAE